MQFRAREAANVRTALHLYQAGEKGPMPAEAQRYREFRERVELQFGAENVSDRQPFLTH